MLVPLLPLAQAQQVLALVPQVSQVFSVQVRSVSVLGLVKLASVPARSVLQKKNVIAQRVWAHLSVRQKPYPYVVFSAG